METNYRHAGVIIVVMVDKWVLGWPWAMGNGPLSLFLDGQFQVILWIKSYFCPINVQLLTNHNVQSIANSGLIKLRGQKGDKFETGWCPSIVLILSSCRVTRQKMRKQFSPGFDQNLSPRFLRNLRLKTGQNGDKTEPAITETRPDGDETENKVDRKELKTGQRTGMGHK